MEYQNQTSRIILRRITVPLNGAGPGKKDTERKIVISDNHVSSNGWIYDEIVPKKLKIHG